MLGQTVQVLRRRLPLLCLQAGSKRPLASSGKVDGEIDIPHLPAPAPVAARA
jgi:hypothetical protein